jgi:ferrochelatase
MSKKIAVVLSTYGEVERLTFNNLYKNSRRIINKITSQIASLSGPMKLGIALFRSVKRLFVWRSKGYQSRLCEITRAQVQQIQHSINEQIDELVAPAEIVVTDSYYFIPPYLEDTLKSLRDNDYIIILSMLPIESEFSCGVACKIALTDLPHKDQHKVDVIGSLWDEQELIQIYLDHIFDSLSGSNIEPSDPDLSLILAIHGTLIKDQYGEPLKLLTGLEETKSFFDKLKTALENDQRFQLSSIKLGCLNHRFGGEWTPESLDRAITELKADQSKSVALFPFGFFADNSEVDLEAKDALLSAGFEKTQYIEAINDSKPFANWIARRLIQRINRNLKIEKAIEKQYSAC